jgi:TRAP-type C4-dicarboxylate transport system permease large subunit
MTPVLIILGMLVEVFTPTEAAAMLGWLRSVEQIPQEFSNFVTGLSNDPLTLLVLANAIFFLAGMVLDSTTATLLIVPIVAPPLVAAGADPVHPGLVVVFNQMIG